MSGTNITVAVSPSAAILSMAPHGTALHATAPGPQVAWSDAPGFAGVLTRVITVPLAALQASVVITCT